MITAYCVCNCDHNSVMERDPYPNENFGSKHWCKLLAALKSWKKTICMHPGKYKCTDHLGCMHTNLTC